MGMVLTVLVPDQNAVYNPAWDTVYSLFWDRNIFSTRQRADLWVLLGRQFENNNIELVHEQPITDGSLGYYFDRTGARHIITSISQRMACVRQ